MSLVDNDYKMGEVVVDYKKILAGGNEATIVVFEAKRPSILMCLSVHCSVDWDADGVSVGDEFSVDRYMADANIPKTVVSSPVVRMLSERVDKGGKVVVYLDSVGVGNLGVLEVDVVSVVVGGE
jgi:hypothetical protein